ncbi:MAG: transporter substrate-binding domain-containing protein [Acetobacteraceae bacterium]|nr:transporter substrate-binding domain-containing protein [Acetobacteraceae bacterium]
MIARRTLPALFLLPAPAFAQAGDALRELAPTGRLRVGIGVAPVGSAFWTRRGPDGRPQGVTIVLAEAMAAALNLPLDLVAMNSSSEVTDAVAAGGVDLAFMPADAERAARVAFGPNYFLFVSTLMVVPGVALTHADQANREGLTIVGIRGTTTLRSAMRAYPRAAFLEATSVDDAMAALRDGRAQAVALGRESLDTLLPQVPGARILDGHFHATGTAVAVPPNRPRALALASDWMERAKADGTVRRALDAGGISGPVAPAGSRIGG